MGKAKRSQGTSEIQKDFQRNAFKLSGKNMWTVHLHRPTIPPKQLSKKTDKPVASKKASANPLSLGNRLLPLSDEEGDDDMEYQTSK